jgi:hypothetical protein
MTIPTATETPAKRTHGLLELRLLRAEANLCDVQRRLPKGALVICTRYTHKESVTLYRDAPNNETQTATASAQ